MYCAECGAKLTHRHHLVQGKWWDDAFICGNYRQLTRDCTMHYIPTQKLEAAILSTIQRVSWYVRNNEAEFIERVREASDQRQEEAVKDSKTQLAKAKRRHKELDGLVKKLYEANATGKLPDKHFTRLLAEYDEEQAALEASMTEWQEQIENWNADKLKTEKFIELVKRYTDFSELTTPMLNEFIEKVVVHEATGGRGSSRRQRLDIYLNFIGAFEVPAHIVTPMEEEAERRRQEEQAAKEAQSRELKKARYEKRKQEKRDFTARKKAGLLTPEEQAEEEKRLAKKREQNQAWREKQKASQPPKPPKPHSLTELARMKREGLPLTPEEAQRLAEYRQRKNEQIRQSQQRRLAREAAEKAEKGKKIA